MEPVIIGSVGVALLLLAFVLNLLRRVSERSPLYLSLNFLGAALAAWYAWDARIIPFVILEGVWGLSAVLRLVTGLKKNPRPEPGA